MARSFHSKHGRNIRLLDNGTVAHRFSGYDEGIVLTKEPIAVGEMFEVKVIEMSSDNPDKRGLVSEIEIV